MTIHSILAGLTISFSLGSYSALNSAMAMGKPSGLKCENVSKGSAYTFCRYQDVKSKNKDVVYFFHGAGADQKKIEKSLINFHDLWKKKVGNPPIFAAITFGPEWVLTSKNNSPKSGLFDEFKDQVLPDVEKKLPQGGRRLLLGQSMGGLNGTAILMKAPKMFSRYALLCPAIFTIHWYDPPQDVTDYIQRTNADPNLIQYFFRIEKEYYPNAESLKPDDPLLAGAQYLSPTTPPFYLTFNTDDKFGLAEGAKAFLGIAKQAGASFASKEFPGGHCNIDYSLVFKYLSQR